MVRAEHQEDGQRRWCQDAGRWDEGGIQGDDGGMWAGGTVPGTNVGCRERMAACSEGGDDSMQ